MNDHDHDIDALLDALTPSASGFGHVEMYRTDALRFHAALTALVAERDGLQETIVLLQSRAESSEALNSTAVSIISERDALRKRVAELEAQPPADRDLDRELRERLVCAALTGACSLEGWVRLEDLATHAVGAADATLAAMRKGVARE